MSQVFFSLIGTGSYLPKNVVSNVTPKIVDTSDEWIRSRSGIRERRFAGKAKQPTIWLLLQQSKQYSGWNRTAQIDPANSRHLTPDMQFPHSMFSTKCWAWTT